MVIIWILFKLFENPSLFIRNRFLLESFEHLVENVALNILMRLYNHLSKLMTLPLTAWVDSDMSINSRFFALGGIIQFCLVVLLEGKRTEQNALSSTAVFLRERRNIEKQILAFFQLARIRLLDWLSSQSLEMSIFERHRYKLKDTCKYLNPTVSNVIK